MYLISTPSSLLFPLNPRSLARGFPRPAPGAGAPSARPALTRARAAPRPAGPRAPAGSPLRAVPPPRPPRGRWPGYHVAGAWSDLRCPPRTLCGRREALGPEYVDFGLLLLFSPGRRLKPREKLESRGAQRAALGKLTLRQPGSCQTAPGQRRQLPFHLHHHQPFQWEALSVASDFR